MQRRACAALLLIAALLVAPLSSKSEASTRPSAIIVAAPSFQSSPGRGITIQVCWKHMPGGTTGNIQVLKRGHWEYLSFDKSFPLASSGCAFRRDPVKIAGLYKYRAQFLKKADRPRTVGTAVATILEKDSISELCGKDYPAFDIGGASNHLTDGCKPVIVPLPDGGTFTAVLVDGNIPTSPGYDTLVQYGDTSCHSITLSAVNLASPDVPAGNVTLAIVQNGVAATMTLAPGGLGQESFPLSNEPWSLEAWSSTGKESVYVGGQASCWNKSGTE